MNRLAQATSPYLLHHADNPVVQLGRVVWRSVAGSTTRVYRLVLGVTNQPAGVSNSPAGGDSPSGAGSPEVPKAIEKKGRAGAGLASALAELGCTSAQGYHFFKPMPSDRIATCSARCRTPPRRGSSRCAPDGAS